MMVRYVFFFLEKELKGYSLRPVKTSIMREGVEIYYPSETLPRSRGLLND